MIEAANGHEALEILERRREGGEDNRVPLVLSDVVMPEMGGIALLHNIKQRGLMVRVVLLTGHPLKKELDDLRARGADLLLVGWLLEPPRLERLAQMVAQGLEKAQK